jgi:hypothetical protein
VQVTTTLIVPAIHVGHRQQYSQSIVNLRDQKLISGRIGSRIKPDARGASQSSYLGGNGYRMALKRSCDQALHGTCTPSASSQGRQRRVVIDNGNDHNVEAQESPMANIDCSAEWDVAARWAESRTARASPAEQTFCRFSAIASIDARRFSWPAASSWDSFHGPRQKALYCLKSMLQRPSLPT